VAIEFGSLCDQNRTDFARGQGEAIFKDQSSPIMNRPIVDMSIGRLR
jgi:hypothetical protein